MSQWLCPTCKSLLFCKPKLDELIDCETRLLNNKHEKKESQNTETKKHHNTHSSSNLWRCENKHTFDIAKEGYVNLLLAHQKNSKAPGDNKNMVNARRAFLSEGHYAPLANSIGECLLTFVKSCATQGQYTILDAGCGEAYYLGEVTSAFLNNPNFVKSGMQLNVSGIDISKPAIQKASKRFRDISNTSTQAIYNFAVASTFDLPIPDTVINAVIQVFAPSSSNEVSRVLKRDGIWIKVEPNAGHLFELKQLVYDAPKKHTEKPKKEPNFTLVDAQQLSFKIDLQNTDARQNLLSMTPFYWSISQDKKQRLLDLLTQVTADFSISVYSRD